MEASQPARTKISEADSGLLARFAHFIARHRRAVIGIWIVLTLFGGFAAGQLSKRWYQSFSIPGKPAYEASQRTLKAFGVGVRPPDVVVFHTAGDATQSSEQSVARQARSPTVKTSGSALGFQGIGAGGGL